MSFFFSCTIMEFWLMFPKNGICSRRDEKDSSRFKRICLTSIDVNSLAFGIKFLRNKTGNYNYGEILTVVFIVDLEFVGLGKESLGGCRVVQEDHRLLGQIFQKLQIHKKPPGCLILAQNHDFFDDFGLKISSPNLKA